VRAPGRRINVRMVRSSLPSTLLTASNASSPRAPNVRSRGPAGRSPHAGQYAEAVNVRQFGQTQGGALVMSIDSTDGEGSAARSIEGERLLDGCHGRLC